MGGAVLGGEMSPIMKSWQRCSNCSSACADAQKLLHVCSLSASTGLLPRLAELQCGVGHDRVFEPLRVLPQLHIYNVSRY